MIEKYKPLRQSILDFHTAGDYEDSIKECYTLLEQVLDEENCKDDEWYCYHMLSFNYYKLNEYYLAIENGKYAAIEIKDYNLGNYARTAWLLGNCHKETGNIKEASKMYRMCLQYYKSIECNTLRLNCTFNIAKLLKMPNVMKKTLNLYIAENKKTDNTIYNQKEYEQTVIREMYIDTFNMYINSDKKQEAIGFLNKIQDKDTRKLLSKKLLIA